MSDLLSLLPDFSLNPQTSNIISSLETQNITVSDLLTLEQLDISKRTSISLLDLRRFTKEVVQALHSSLKSRPVINERAHATNIEGKDDSTTLGVTGLEAWKDQKLISTTDAILDQLLSGGIMTGGITEIVGESGAGKTQLLLQLCCGVQLPSSLGGLSKTAVYISTEASLPTTRLVQLLSSFKSRFEGRVSEDELSTDHVLSITCGDLESQEHILSYQLPVVVEKHNVGLIILDSVAANFRAEYDGASDSLLTRNTMLPKKTGPALLAERGKQLVKLSQILRNLARMYNIGVIVANQVSDHFERVHPIPSSASDAETMSLDHQARWFTGWGDTKPEMDSGDRKVPALGLVWANSIGARIVLQKRLVSDSMSNGTTWRRSMKVVFAPWVEGGRECQYVITADGVRGVASGSGSA